MADRFSSGLNQGLICSISLRTSADSKVEAPGLTSSHVTGAWTVCPGSAVAACSIAGWVRGGWLLLNTVMEWNKPAGEGGV